MLRENKYFLNYILKLFSRLIISIKVNSNYIKLNIKKEYFLFLIKFLSFHSFMRYNLLTDIISSDNLVKVKRFELSYILLSIDFNNLIVLSINLKQNDVIHTISNFFKSGNWMEREIWDMYGIYFYKHKDLRRILTDYGFEGFPFRKDFPLNGYFEIRYDENKQYLIYEPVELMQNLRSFNFINPLLRKCII